MPENTPAPKPDFWAPLESKAAELTTKLGRTIIPFSLGGDNEDDHIIGYLYEMDGITDAKLFGAKLTGLEVSIPKAIQALESLIVWSESDPRLRTKKCMNGAAMFLLSLVETALPELKKK